MHEYSSIPQEYLLRHGVLMVVWTIVTLFVFWHCKMYHSVWRLASVAEACMICTAFLILLPVYTVIVLIPGPRIPISYYLVGYMLSMCAATATRFSYRLYYLFTRTRTVRRRGRRIRNAS